MSLYPSLEDMKIDQLMKAQHSLVQTVSNNVGYQNIPNTSNMNNTSSPTHLANVYPALKDFMGLDLSSEIIALNMPEHSQPTSELQNFNPATGKTFNNLIAPLSGQSLGLQKAQVTHGIRQLILCKDKHGKVGLRVKAIDNGIFVTLVIDKSPAALAGLRFGDQILEINGIGLAGYTMDKVHDLLKKSPVNGISVVVRDRPFERTITLQKDSAGLLGFQFKNGKIITIVKDSSAARNGVLINHQLLEIDGQNVVGLKDKETAKIIDECQRTVTITVMPSFIYDHMIKRMAGSLLKDLMDHSIPNL
ncbi:syntenin-1-like [Coccinella septempunctata]|uniref:syntenin-1-like n=1 Tax=Coccinella septempunctata TaxID=41139 RepID=UPI001D09863B|nr:syntenin-1-like [Coccinella septempunctata]